MESKYLFPHYFRSLGYLLAIPGLILGYLSIYKSYNIPGFELHLREHNSLSGNATENFTNELALTLFIVGLLFIAFCKLKREDELTAKIRLNALYWAILVNYGIYALVILFITICNLFQINVGGGIFGPYTYYFSFSLYNLFTPLVIFIAIFGYQLYRNKNEFAIKPIRYLPNKPYLFLGKWFSIITVSLFVISSIFYKEAYGMIFVFLPLILLLWLYSKEKNEDEYIESIRLEAMQIAVYVNYAILLLLNFLVYGADFWTLQFINLITIPVIFIAWFQYKLYRINQQTEVKTNVL